MLIPNINSAATAPRLTSDSAPAPVAAPQAQAPAAPPPPPTQAQIQTALDSMNKVLKQNDSGLEFSVDKDTKRTVFKLVESNTGKVIRQYPTEDLLAIARAIDQMQHQGHGQGLLLNQKA
jgi:flagellar protein FlaG